MTKRVFIYVIERFYVLVQGTNLAPSAGHSMMVNLTIGRSKSSSGECLRKKFSSGHRLALEYVLLTRTSRRFTCTQGEIIVSRCSSIGLTDHDSLIGVLTALQGRKDDRA